MQCVARQYFKYIINPLLGSNYFFISAAALHCGTSSNNLNNIFTHLTPCTRIISITVIIKANNSVKQVYP